MNAGGAPRSHRLALFGVAASLIGASFVAVVGIALSIGGQAGQLALVSLAILLIADMALVGGLLAARRPDNVIGRLLILVGLLATVAFGASSYARLDQVLGGGRLTLVDAAVWLGSWIFVPGVVITVVYVPLLFPSGHPPSPRWRILEGAAAVGMVLGSLQAASTPGPLQDAGWIVNPVHVPEPFLDWIQTIGAMSALIALPSFLIVVANLLARYRASRGVERAQLKWFLFVATIAASMLGLSLLSIGPVSDAAWAVGLVAIACLPLAIAVAILRYRLYEIDRIVSRTLSYAVVSAVLVAVFAGVNLVLETVLASVTQASSLAVAASTLAVVATFQPLRRRVQETVEHRFDRDRYEADRVAAAFAGRLKVEVDPARIRAELEGALQQTLAPTSIRIWLRGEAREPAQVVPGVDIGRLAPGPRSSADRAAAF